MEGGISVSNSPHHHHHQPFISRSQDFMISQRSPGVGSARAGCRPGERLSAAPKQAPALYRLQLVVRRVLALINTDYTVHSSVNTMR